MTDKEDKTVRQFVLFCRTALMYEKKNYYSEQRNRAERETHMEMLSLKQSGMLEKIFDTIRLPFLKKRKKPLNGKRKKKRRYRKVKRIPLFQS